MVHVHTLILKPQTHTNAGAKPFVCGLLSGRNVGSEQGGEDDVMRAREALGKKEQFEQI